MPTRTDDLVEIQQLLARYAVTITQGDIDGLIGVFTPDGTYSAFGDTYRLDRFPELVDAAPKGLFLTGTAAGRPRGRCRERHPAVVLYRARHTRYANRLLPRHLLADRRRLAAENPCHDVHSAQRGARLRAPTCRRASHAVNVEQFRADLRAWLDEHDLTPGPDHSLQAQMRQLARVHRALYDADWMRYGWPVEVGGLGGPALLRAIVGEEVVGRRLAEPGPYSMVEVLRTHHDRLRACRTRSRNGAPPTQRPRTMVSGLFRTRLRKRPGVVVHPRHPAGRQLDCQRAEGLDQFRAVFHSMHPAHPHRAGAFKSS